MTPVFGVKLGHGLLPLGTTAWLVAAATGEEAQTMNHLSVASPAFENGSPIPPKYTCDGADVSPPLAVAAVPREAKSLALIADDPDAPGGTWVHWLLWNVDPKAGRIGEASVPSGAIQGRNGFGRNTYGGPCPPSGTHRYFFKVYALDTTLDLKAGSAKPDLERAMQGHVLSDGQVIGLYKRR
jgi:Raf kinase inhibitor-like YbhB/YbcL family protein